MDHNHEMMDMKKEEHDSMDGHHHESPIDDEEIREEFQETSKRIKNQDNQK